MINIVSQGLKESHSSQSRIFTTLIVALALTSIFILPFSNLDPIFIPKFAILCPTILYLVLNLSKTSLKNFSKIEAMILMSFLLMVSISTVVGPRPILDKVFGEYRRGNGLLFWLSILGVYLICRSFSNPRSNWLFFRAFWLVVGINSIYGLIQIHNLDPIPWTYRGEPIGFLGNSNFLTSFAAIGASSGLPFLFERQNKLFLRLSLLSLVLMSIYLSVSSGSIQGILVLTISLLACLLFLSIEGRLGSLKPKLVLSLSFLGLLAVAIMLPRIPKLYSSYSINQRIDYMLAGMRLIHESPLIGVGLDSFADFYPKYRSIDAAKRPGAAFTDSAHSVPIDLWISGGFFFFAVFMAFVVMILKSAFIKLKLTKKCSTFEFASFLVFLGFLVQAVISINHVVMGMWAFGAAGIIQAPSLVVNSGRQKNGRNSAMPTLSKQGKGQISSKVIRQAIAVSVSSLLFFVIFASLSKDSNLRFALQQDSPDEVLNVMEHWPKLKYHYVFASLVLTERERDDLAIVLARDAIKTYPGDIDLLNVITNNDFATFSEKLLAKSKLKLLDPKNFSE